MWFLSLVPRRVLFIDNINFSEALKSPRSRETFRRVIAYVKLYLRFPALSENRKKVGETFQNFKSGPGLRDCAPIGFPYLFPIKHSYTILKPKECCYILNTWIRTRIWIFKRRKISLGPRLLESFYCWRRFLNKLTRKAGILGQI